MLDTREHATAKSTFVEVWNVEVPGTDVVICVTKDNERLLAASTEGLGGKHTPGRVWIFTIGKDGKLTYKRTLSTGECRLPDQIKWTKDCRAIVCACEGEPVTDSSTTPPSLGTDRHSL